MSSLFVSGWWYNPLNLQSAAFSKDPRTWPKGAYVRNHFGQDVLWHEATTASSSTTTSTTTTHRGRHLTANQLERYRAVGDPPVDRIFALRRQEGHPVRAGEDLLALAATARPDAALASEVALHEFYATYAAFPATWAANCGQLARGQEVFLAYLPAIGMALYYRSLVPGFSIPRIAAVLLATGYLAPPASRESVRNRLMDTGLFLLHCFAGTRGSVDDILPGGDGWKSALYVRLLHAKVRHGLLQRSATGSKPTTTTTTTRAWDWERLGIPINEEDMNATLLAFAVNPLLGTEMLLGFPVPKSDVLAYLAVWRYLGWLLGVPVDENDNDTKWDERTAATFDETNIKLRPLDPCGSGWITDKPDPIQHSYAVFQSIILHLMEPNQDSVKVAHHLLWQGRVVDAKPAERSDQERWFYFRALQCRRFIGDPLADALQLPLRKTRVQQFKQYFVSNISLLLLTFYSWLGLPWSPVRPLLVSWHRNKLRKISGFCEFGHRKRVKKQLSPGGGGGTVLSEVCPFAMVAPPMH